MVTRIINNSLNEITYQKIREDIMYLILEPGTEVSVQKLADRYGVSRTPVREAFIRLQKEGLVEIFPQKMTIISKIDLKRVWEEWFIRTTLEYAVTDRFIEKCTLPVLAEMKEIIHTQKKYANAASCREFYALDNDIHRLIFETAEEFLAWSTIKDVISHYNRIRTLSTKLEGVGEHIIEEHEAIVIAAENKDIAGMRKILKQHFDKILEQTNKMVAQFPQYITNSSECSRI